MPAQLTRFGIDQNSSILSIAWRVIFVWKFFLLQRIVAFFSPHDCLAWWYFGQEIDWALWLNKIVMLWTLLVPVINQIFLILCESRNYDGLKVILGLQWSLVEFLAFHLVVSPILTLATKQITATQVFSTELMFAIPNFVADLVYFWWIFRPIY